MLGQTLGLSDVETGNCIADALAEVAIGWSTSSWSTASRFLAARRPGRSVAGWASKPSRSERRFPPASHSASRGLIVDSCWS